MSNLEDFEDFPYEDEYKNMARYTEKEFQECIKRTEEIIESKYLLDKMTYIEKEKEFYKSIIINILQNKE